MSRDTKLCMTEKRYMHINVSLWECFLVFWISCLHINVLVLIFWKSFGHWNVRAIFYSTDDIDRPWFKVWLRPKDYAPQVRPDWGSNPWPLDHEQYISCPEMHILTTKPLFITRTTGMKSCSLASRAYYTWPQLTYKESRDCCSNHSAMCDTRYHTHQLMFAVLYLGSSCMYSILFLAAAHIILQDRVGSMHYSTNIRGMNKAWVA